MDRRKSIKTVGLAAGATLLSGMGIAGQRHSFPKGQVPDCPATRTSPYQT